MFEPKVTRRNISRNTAVKNLWDKFGEDALAEGDVIKYEALESVIGEKRTSYRFRGIIGRWKDELLTASGKLLKCRINVGYEVCDTHQRLLQAHTLQKSGIKKIQRSAMVQDTVDMVKLTSDERTLFAKLRNVNAALDISYKRELAMPSI